MAVVNCNDDSFYAPSRALFDKAVERALAFEKDGASIIDFGAESSRPFSSWIDGKDEIERLIPVIADFRKKSSLPVSVDTRKAFVARSALDAGADIINDISALNDDPEMAGVCAEYGAAVVLVHGKGVTACDAPSYGVNPGEFRSFFDAAAARAAAAGIPKEKIILDPGIGFSKTLKDNLEILSLPSRLAELCGNDYPVLVGLSRKSFIGALTGRDAEQRLSGTLAANAAAIMGGALIIRVHDVKEHVDLVKVLYALRAGK